MREKTEEYLFKSGISVGGGGGGGTSGGGEGGVTHIMYPFL